MLKESLDDFFDLLFNYRKGLSRIAQKRNIWNGLFIFLIVNLIVSAATFNIPSAAGSGLCNSFFSTFFPPESLSGTVRLFPLATILAQLVFGPLYFLLNVAIIYLVAELFGGRGGVSRLGAVIGYGQYPYLFVALGGLFNRYANLNVLGILTFACFLWSLFLKIAGLKIACDFSWGRAILVYFMPLLALVAAMILFVLLAIVFLLPLIIQFMEHFPFTFPF